jgi:hypothetical protein
MSEPPQQDLSTNLQWIGSHNGKYYYWFIGSFLEKGEVGKA